MSWSRKSQSNTSLPGTSSSLTSSSASAGIGLVPRSVQLDFDKEEEKIKQLEKTNKQFYKDVKCYVEKIDELNKSETKMVNNLSNLANPSTVKYLSDTNENFTSEEIEFLNKLRQWKEMLNEHNSTCDSLKASCQLQVIDPMKKLNSMFPQVYKAIERRQSAYNELCKQQGKLEKALEKERIGDQIVKIEQLNHRVSMSKQQFEREHSLLMEELPKLYNSRVDYIRPCVTALLGSQVQLYDSYSNFYESVLKLNDVKSSAENSSYENQSADRGNRFDRHVSAPGLSVENLDDEIQKSLNEIKTLSIVSGD